MVSRGVEVKVEREEGWKEEKRRVEPKCVCAEG